MKMMKHSKSSSIYSNESEVIDHYFRVSNVSALKVMFEANPEKMNEKEAKVLNN